MPFRHCTRKLGSRLAQLSNRTRLTPFVKGLFASVYLMLAAQLTMAQKPLRRKHHGTWLLAFTGHRKVPLRPPSQRVLTLGHHGFISSCSYSSAALTVNLAGAIEILASAQWDGPKLAVRLIPLYLLLHCDPVSVLPS